MPTNLKVEVVEIGELEKHPNADTLSIVKVKGWQCVVKTEEFKGVKLGAYIPIDSLIPEPLQTVLPAKRIKTIKLRGIISQGVILPAREHWKLGDDVAEELGITKYEPPEPAILGGEDTETPEGFIKYTDIERIQNYPNVITPDTEVIISEKIHGCLPYHARILIGANKTKKINGIKKGDYIFGVDSGGKLVPTRVLNVFNNGKATEWVTVSGKRRMAGRGNSFFAVHCTPNHKFWVCDKRNYMSADKLKQGDRVLTVRSAYEITPIQEQVLIGIMLGDAYYRECTSGVGMLSWGHKSTMSEYMDWIDRGLGSLSTGYRNSQISGYGTKMMRSNTIANIHIKALFSDWLDSCGKKRIPESLISKISPVSLAFWYMDDGSLSCHTDQEDRVCFAVCDFNGVDCSVLIRALKKFGINAVYYKSGVYSRIRLNADDAEKFFILIVPYIPKCMQYKLPLRYRGFSGWLPPVESVYKPVLVELTVDKVAVNSKISSVKYDLETETHNFFANGILVHNSNARYGMIDLEFYVGSHTRTKKRSEDPKRETIFWQIALQEKIEEKLRAKGYDNIVLFGEIFGCKVQKLQYGCAVNERKVAFYDVWKDNHYLEFEQAYAIIRDLGLDFVPILYQGRFGDVVLSSFDEKKTFYKEAHGIEGVVIRPKKERFNAEIGRVVLKYISPVYLLKGGE